MDDFTFYDPVARTGLSHDPFKSIVAPRPIGWISTLDAEGRPNLAPYSFFNGVCTSPPMVMFSSEGKKDSVTNAEATGEFVCNLATRTLAEQMNATSAAVPRGVSEFEIAGLAMAPSRLVKPPRVQASPAALECRVVQVLRVHDVEGRATNAHVTIGQIVGIHVRRDCLRNGSFDPTLAGTIARCGGPADYSELAELFQMYRPS